jgi:DNA-binding YbaB/EbfC family protein
MSKRGDPRRAQPTPRMNPANSQGALQALQQRMTDVQNALVNETLQVTAGGGAVMVTINGQQQIQAVKISQEAMSAGDIEMLQDLVLTAVNEAIEKSQELASQRMSQVTGGLGLPGL